VPGSWSSLEDWLEFLASVLMALAVVLTAYSAYQATRWNGVQATNFAMAGSLRTQANSLTTIGVTEVSYDANIFAALLIEFRDADFSDPAVLDEARRFADTLVRDEAAMAMDDWLNLNPFENPDAPRTPLELPSYQNANLEEAQQLIDEAALRFQDAKDANQNGDNYVLATILFAAVLFFTGLRVRTYRVRSLVQIFAMACLAGGLIRLLTLPFH
jgi:hypothetical protein